MPICHGIISNMPNISRIFVENFTDNINEKQQFKNHSDPKDIWVFNKTNETRNNSYQFGISRTSDFYNQSFGNGTDTEFAEPVGFIMANIRLLKAIVLGVVVVILLLSTCKFILKTFSRYSEDGDRKD